MVSGVWGHWVELTTTSSGQKAPRVKGIGSRGRIQCHRFASSWTDLFVNRGVFSGRDKLAGWRCDAKVYPTLLRIRRGVMASRRVSKARVDRGHPDLGIKLRIRAEDSSPGEDLSLSVQTAVWHAGCGPRSLLTTNLTGIASVDASPIWLCPRG